MALTLSQATSTAQGRWPSRHSAPKVEGPFCFTEIALGLLNTGGGAKRNGASKLLDERPAHTASILCSEFGSIYAYMYSLWRQYPARPFPGRIAGPGSAQLASSRGMPPRAQNATSIDGRQSPILGPTDPLPCRALSERGHHYERQSTQDIRSRRGSYPVLRLSRLRAARCTERHQQRGRILRHRNRSSGIQLDGRKRLQHLPRKRCRILRRRQLPCFPTC